VLALLNLERVGVTYAVFIREKLHLFSLSADIVGEYDGDNPPAQAPGNAIAGTD
jgi:hypothetical protein